MRTFIATMTWDVDAEAAPAARKLLRAQLVGRRWQEKYKDKLMPQNSVWMARKIEGDDTTDAIHEACADDLRKAVAAVVKMGQPVQVLRAWIHVSGAGTYGLATLALESPSDAD